MNQQNSLQLVPIRCPKVWDLLALELAAPHVAKQRRVLPCPACGGGIVLIARFAQVTNVETEETREQLWWGQEVHNRRSE